MAEPGDKEGKGENQAMDDAGIQKDHESRICALEKHCGMDKPKKSKDEIMRERKRS